MIRFKLAVALLLGSTVACAQNEKKLQADFLKPTLEYRMNVNRHSMPRDDRERDAAQRPDIQRFIQQTAHCSTVLRF